MLALAAFAAPQSSGGNGSDLAAAAPPAAPLFTLQLEDVGVVTSCLSWWHHAVYACAASPSPNFTATPTSLAALAFASPSLAATRVTLACNATLPRYPCLASVARTGEEALAALRAAAAAGEALGSQAPPTHIYLAASMA